MKNSVYNYFFKNKENYYVYNTLSTSICCLDTDVYNLLLNGNIEKIPVEYLEPLFDNGIITYDDSIELSEYQYFYDKVRYAYHSNQLYLMFIPSYGCNLRCPYCYEGIEKKFCKITNEQIDSIVKFVKNQVEESKPVNPIKKLNISLFGGEPLLFFREIEYFCERLNDFTNDNNIELVIDMTSNFTLVNKKVLDFVKKYDIYIQITIDGPKNEHDKKRIFENGNGTYDLILKNLKYFKDNNLESHIIIRVNLDNQNVEFADEIIENLRDYSDDIYFGFLESYEGKNNEFKKCVSNDCVANTLSNKLYPVLRKYDLVVPQAFGKKTPCSLNTINKFAIDNYLNVYKCELLINNEKFAIGKILENGELLLKPEYYNQINYSPFNSDKCRKCKMLPLCGGGCPAKSSYVNGGSLEPNCLMTEKDLIVYLQEYVNENE